MVAHPAIAAVPETGTPDRSLLQALLVQRTAFIFDDAEDPETFVPTGEGGSVVLVLGYQGKWFWYDAADSTTAHDGVVCIVTADGKRYKTFGIDLLITSVISHSLTTPPVSPTYGDAYRIPSGATGAWAGHADEIAVWTPREEWEFIEPKVGWLVWTRGLSASSPPVGYDAAYHYDSVQGAWVSGLGSQVFLDKTVPQAATINFGKFFIVENQTTNAPPSGSNSPPNAPVVGDAYIIGPSPTGSWTGHSGKLAICEVDGSFTIIVPGEGWRAYDKSLDGDYQFSGSAWQSARGTARINIVRFTANGTYTKSARLIGCLVHVIGGGGGSAGGSGTSGSAGGTSWFGALVASGGGAGGTSSAGGPGGAATSTGYQGGFIPAGVADGLILPAAPAAGGSNRGQGGRPVGGAGGNIGGGGGGGLNESWFNSSQVATNETITIGAGGAGGGGGAAGTAGEVVVYEYIEI